MLHDCGFQCRILLISERSRACSNKIQLQNVGIPKYHTLTLWLWEQRTVCPMAWYCNTIEASGYKQIICLLVKNTNRIYHYLKSSLLLTDSFYMFYSLKIFVVHCLLAIKPLLDLGTEIWIHLCHRKTNCKKEDPNISQHNYNHHARNHSSCAQTWSPRPLFPLISAVKEYPTPATWRLGRVSNTKFRGFSYENPCTEILTLWREQP